MIVVVPVRVTEPAPIEHGRDPAVLYRASVADVVTAALSSGGDVLVNHYDEDADPARAVLSDHGVALESIRFEPQVGSTRSARVGNTVTHLLAEEEATSVAVLEPTAPLVGRPTIDGVAMALRRTDVILGPALQGSCYIAGFTGPIDFTDVYEEQPLEAITRRAVEQGCSVDTERVMPTLETEAGLETVRAILTARRTADRAVPTVVADLLVE